MPIELLENDLLRILEEAIGIARSPDPVPRVWLDRVERMGGLTYSKTYTAALGGALLARATDDQVDCLTHKKDQGARAYQLRQTTEYLAKRNEGRYHLGTKSKNPVNNSPFYGSRVRVDEFTGINPRAKPAYELFRDCMVDLNNHSSGDALLALAAYLRIRMRVARVDRERAQHKLDLADGMTLRALLAAAEVFVKENAEGGKRGQSLVAAVLDCAFQDVVLQNINSPHPGDVRVMRDGKVSLTVEVKQVKVDEAIGIQLAREAKEMGADAALLVVISDDHAPLDRERVVRTSTREYGIAIAVVESVDELVHQVSVFGGGVTQNVLRKLPEAYLRRLTEHEVSGKGIRRWIELMEARGALE